MIFFNYFKHFKRITKHRWYVFMLCCKAGIPLQGFLHDLSKYSLIEFLEGVKYYNDECSPINVCKKENGWSRAWLHHKGRNPHHYEYWQDNFNDGGQPIQMPYKYALELVCDYIAAGKTYYSKKFSYQKEFEWWQKRRHKAMHPQTALFVTFMLKRMAENNDCDCLRKNISKNMYEEAIRNIATVEHPVNRMYVVKGKDKFVRDFNKNVVKKEFLDSCKKAGKLFSK